MILIASRVDAWSPNPLFASRNDAGSSFCRFWPLAVVVAVLWLDSTVDAQTNPVNPLQTNRKGIVNVGVASSVEGQVGIRWFGSGFLVGKRCQVVTAKHVIEGAPQGSLVVRFSGSGKEGETRTYSARVIAQSDSVDLAILQFLGGRGSKLCGTDQYEPFALAERRERASLSGEAVFVLGFPVLEGEAPRDVPILRAGHVASAELDWDGASMLLLDLTGVPGFSGGPVILRESGEVIGVVFGPGRTRREYDLEWATPLSKPSLDQLLSSK